MASFVCHAWQACERRAMTASSAACSACKGEQALPDALAHMLVLCSGVPVCVLREPAMPLEPG